MRAVVFDRELRFVRDYPVPSREPGWAMIRVSLAGICKTDIEITKGYMGFSGVVGHEFVGIVDEAEDPVLVGKRVVGEINAACGKCQICDIGLGRHCPHRSTLGIDKLDGCMADYCVLPVSNLVRVPDGISDERAVFIEPLSAACEILQQLRPELWERAVVLGDGRLGILCSWVLCTVLSDVTLAGHHPEKLGIAQWRGLKTTRDAGKSVTNADIVVEATGSPDGLREAMEICGPRGRIVLKSTIAAHTDLNLSPLVINEQTLIGSRCGRFQDGLRILESYPDMPIERMITGRYSIEESLAAFDRAVKPDALKILIKVD
ncbi:MAG: alcohol dehydrogenase catalytic domain-containing protein [Dehalococcoidia bacterium]